MCTPMALGMAVMGAGAAYQAKVASDARDQQAEEAKRQKKKARKRRNEAMMDRREERRADASARQRPTARYRSQAPTAGFGARSFFTRA